MTVARSPAPFVPPAPHLDARAFPTLDAEELALLAPCAAATYTPGQYLFHAGDPDIDFFVVAEGSVDILNPAADDALVVSHAAGHFVGDIDLLTRRPVIVSAVARSNPTRCLRIPGTKLRSLLLTVPRLADKILMAFQVRRQLLQASGTLGLKVAGPAHCRDTTVVREFLYKNFVPHTWFDTEQPDGARLLTRLGNPKKTPAIQCSDGRVLLNPTLRDLAKCAGIWRECPGERYDLAVVGAGPAGIAAAVYAASEGLRTVVLDRLGPGGQAGGSSKIENFIGFPAGLSGTDLATRGVLQMLKFGADMVAPIAVERLEPGAAPDQPHTLHLDCGGSVQADTVLVATGVAWRKLAAPGAERFERAGVYYACTAVEARLHDNADVAVVGAGNSAGQAAVYLAERCPRTVHLLVRRDELGPGMSDYLSNRIRSTPNIKLHTGTEISKVLSAADLAQHPQTDPSADGRALSPSPGTPGEGRGEGSAKPTSEQWGHTPAQSASSPSPIRNPQSTIPNPPSPREIAAVELTHKPDNTTTFLPVTAVYVFIGAEPAAPWLPDTVARDDHGYLLTGIDATRTGRWPLSDRDPCPLETTLPRVLAAGDIRAGSTKRVGFAVGDGSLAVTCTHRLRLHLNPNPR